MPSADAGRMAVLQGTLDLIVLRTLKSMGPQHAYAIATRLQQISDDLLRLNQGTLYPALVRLEQQGGSRGLGVKPRVIVKRSSTPLPGPVRRRLPKRRNAGGKCHD